MTKQINQIWNFFKKAVVKWKYLKSKNKFRVCIEGTEKEFKENFNYEFKEEPVPPTPTVKQLLLEHIKDFKGFKVSVERRLGKLKEFNKKQAEFNKKQEQFNNEITKRFDKQEEFNKKQAEFNNQQIEFNNKIIGRIDNLVVKNNLKE